MKIYIYWNNKQKPHGEMLFHCKAENILEADKQLEITTKLNPVKNPWISCEIKNDTETNIQ